MWSTRVGAEVMKPLATPVLGGMASSLLHVLIVTPVLFFWIQERRLRLQHEPLPETERMPMHRRRVLIATGALVLLVLSTTLVWRLVTRDQGVTPQAAGSVVQVVRAGELDVVVLSESGTLRTGRNTFTIEFRRAGTETLVDAGRVHASANMTMPGMAMSGNVQVMPSGLRGRYRATAEFGMAGAWPMAIEWDGPAGKGFVNFEGGVQ
jgi:Cu(I)/Ag(I) efflux system membrane protein CusA/SilA